MYVKTNIGISFVPGWHPPPAHGFPENPSKQWQTPWLLELTMQWALTPHHTPAHAVKRKDINE